MPIGEGELAGRTARYPELRGIARAAETAGLDSIWVYDHLLFRFPGEPTTGIHEAWSMLAALAADTERVDLGTLVMAVPFRNPAILAKMAATVDEISAGRLILGIGTGWHEPEFDAFGIPFDHRASRFEEALQIIVPMLRTGRADFTGRYHAATDVALLPHGPRTQGPPILIAARGPRMLRLAARYADAWNAAWFGDVAQSRTRVGQLRQALADEGRDPASMTITAGINVVFPDLLARGDEPPERAHRGTPEEIAPGLHAYAKEGIDHLIAAVTPSTPEAMEALAEAARLARS